MVRLSKPAKVAVLAVALANFSEGLDHCSALILRRTNGP
jgi:hypothetical protein